MVEVTDWLWVRIQVIRKQRSNKGFREEWLLMTERGEWVKCFGWSQLQLWLCGVMSLAVSFSSLSLSLAALEDISSVLTTPVCMCVCAHGAPVLSADPGQQFGWSCQYSLPSLKLLLAMTHSVSQFPSVCFFLLLSHNLFTIDEGSALLVDPGKSVKLSGILLKVRRDLFSHWMTHFRDLHPKSFSSSRRGNSGANILWN